MSSAQLVTATVNPDTLPGTNEILIIARELATDRFTFVEIQKKYNLSDAQAKLLKDNKLFQDTFKISCTEWQSIKNTEQRVKLQALWGLEDLLPSAVARATDKNEALSSVASIMKNLTDLGGMGGDKNKNVSNTERVQITINLGTEQIKIDKAKDPIELNPSEIQSLPEGSGEGTTLQLVSPKT